MAAESEEAEPSAAADSAPIDIDRVESIAAGDASFAHELLSTYVNSAQQLLGELRAAITAADAKAIARTTHKLKGASGNVGAKRMQRLAEQIETLTDPGREAELKLAADTLELEAQRVQGFVGQRYPGK